MIHTFPKEKYDFKKNERHQESFYCGDFYYTHNLIRIINIRAAMAVIQKTKTKSAFNKIPRITEKLLTRKKTNLMILKSDNGCTTPPLLCLSFKKGLYKANFVLRVSRSLEM